MKRVARPITSAHDYEISKEELQEKASIAEKALLDFKVAAKSYKRIFDHMDSIDFKNLDLMLETLQDVQLGVYLKHDEDYSDEQVI